MSNEEAVVIDEGVCMMLQIDRRHSSTGELNDMSTPQPTSFSQVPKNTIKLKLNRA